VPNDKRIDWTKIRAEYIAGGISQRKLAAKYHVSFNTLSKKANAEKWAQQREETYNKSATKAQQKKANETASNAVKLEQAKGLLIDRLKRAIEQMPLNGGTHVRQHIQDGNKRMTIDYSIMDMILALEKLSKDEIVADDPLMRLLGDLDEQSNV
jgi:hypothetical protein